MSAENSRQIRTIAEELGLREKQVAGAVSLFQSDATVPFIARYRKEHTGGLDEQQLRAVRDLLAKQQELDKRRRAILESLSERDLLTDELRAALEAASSLSTLEDLYLPYRPKRKTRADAARARGLEPLADAVLGEQDIDPDARAGEFIDAENGVEDQAAALAGARDIIAERINEDGRLREELRELFSEHAQLRSRKARGAGTGDGSRQGTAGDEESSGAEVYRDYFDWSESAARAPSHRVLALFRGEREGYLTVHVLPDEERALAHIRARYGAEGRTADSGRSPGKHAENRRRAEELESACMDAYRRLLAPSLEKERKATLKEQADETAASVFARNLHDLLMEPPLGERALLAVDPGYRTGCKVVCLSAQGELLAHDTIYPLPPQNRREAAAKTVEQHVRRYRLEAVAVGNGTGGREAASFLQDAVASLDIPVMSVSEAGASVYSASETARAEFPDQDVTVRGAISIGRRLIDPLSELVKIDPQSIGVGQYQHDVDQKLLARRLYDTVVSCVNAVGVSLNTASTSLLQYVSGLSRKHAQAIVSARRNAGPFGSREELKTVSGIGAKTFEQAAGFLRVYGGKQPLDASAVHPERYALVERMASDLGTDTSALLGNDELCKQIPLKRYVSDEVGIPTLEDIRNELLQPGRDPRPAFETVSFSDAVHSIDDLELGMQLPGVVTNVTNFGAFVDIGVHRDGLVHISKMADHFVSNPHDELRVHQKLTVTVVDVDRERKRIGLSLID